MSKTLKKINAMKCYLFAEIRMNNKSFESVTFFRIQLIANFWKSIFQVLSNHLNIFPFVLFTFFPVMQDSKYGQCNEWNGGKYDFEIHRQPTDYEYENK